MLAPLPTFIGLIIIRGSRKLLPHLNVSGVVAQAGDRQQASPPWWQTNYGFNLPNFVKPNSPAPRNLINCLIIYNSLFPTPPDVDNGQGHKI